MLFLIKIIFLICDYENKILKGFNIIKYNIMNHYEFENLKCAISNLKY